MERITIMMQSHRKKMKIPRNALGKRPGGSPGGFRLAMAISPGKGPIVPWRPGKSSSLKE